MCENALGIEKCRQSNFLALVPTGSTAAHGQLWRGTQAVKLTPKALAVLCYLVNRAGQVVSKEDLFQSVWADTVVSDAALTVCIQELRRVLRDDATQIHATLRRYTGGGFDLLGKVVSSQSVSSQWSRRRANGKRRKDQRG